MTPRLILIRHPQTQPDPADPASSWRLSPAGEAQVRALVAAPLWDGITAIYTSQEYKAAAVGEATLHPRIARRLMAEVSAPTQARDPAADLTPRELEVLQLIAQGKSNAEIADALVVTERTVKAHVSNLLSKLHLSDRTQAAIYAWREGLIEQS